uniref:tRNA:m(4)X modification enzyme TRM13 n=1 Tax=Timema douglasi TaxID=61478 RepID=A0A7R8VDE9_TIMDO|nr:unnamed protein product [Timema douglasi]
MGQLSYWLGAALHDKKECMLLLVDRASHRHKFDNRFKSVFHPRVCRVRTDIADLCLNNYDQVNAFENVVTIAKHLCGAATELHKCALVSQYDIDSYRSMVLLQLSLEFFVELYILIYIPSGVYAPTTNSEADLLTALERRHLQRIIGTADAAGHPSLAQLPSAFRLPRAHILQKCIKARGDEELDKMAGVGTNSRLFNNVCLSERARSGAVYGGGEWEDGRSAQPYSADSAPGSRQNKTPREKQYMSELLLGQPRAMSLTRLFGGQTLSETLQQVSQGCELEPSRWQPDEGPLE